MTTRGFFDAYRSIVQEINALEVALARCQRDGSPTGMLYRPVCTAKETHWM